MVRALYAVHAARPTAFSFAGNNLAQWEEDGGNDAALIKAMGEQAAFYARGIEKNSKVMQENHRCINIALRWVVGATTFATGNEFVVILGTIGNLGFARFFSGA